MLARASLGKESSANAKAARASKAVAQPRSREREQFLEEFTPPKFSWNICDIAMSTPGDNGRLNRGENGTPGRPAWHFARTLLLPIQAKLKVGAVDDPLEREADRIAEQVMRMPKPQIQRHCACGGTCPECSKKDEIEPKPGPVQMKQIGPTGPSQAEAPPIVHEVLRSPGQPLDAATRAFMEPRFGHDFSRVRIHADADAAQSALDINAHAYTVGHNIAFGSGQYAPGTRKGNRLLAHELTHVVQQAPAPAPFVQRNPDENQASQKFFDPSRASLTEGERAKLLEARRGFHLPDIRTESDTSIVGILIIETGEEIPYHSGEFGGYHGGVHHKLDIRRGPGSGVNRVNRTHVETWAAHVMHKRGLQKGVLLIELEPCSVCGGYDKGKPTVDTKVPGVSSQLPKDAQLIVVDEESATYFSYAPTDPQKRSKAPVPRKSRPGQGPNDAGEKEDAKLDSAATTSESPEGGRARSRQEVKGGRRNRRPDAPRTLGGRGTSRESQRGSLRAGKVEDVPRHRSGGGGDANRLGSPSLEPIPQKTGVSGGFEVKTLPGGPTGGGEGEPTVVTDIPGTTTTAAETSGKTQTPAPKPTGMKASGTSSEGPTVEAELPEATTTPRARGGGIPGSATHGEDFEEGESADITAEEQEAMHGGPSGPSLTQMLGDWLLQGMKNDLTDSTLKMIDQEIPKRLKALESMTMALQIGGDVAYAQITVSKQTTDVVVFSLESVAVGDSYRKGSKDDSSIGNSGITVVLEAYSFALPLLPSVRAIYVHRLKNEIATAEAQRRTKLQDCLQRLEMKGPHVPAFSFLGGACLDVLPMGRGPR